VESVRPVRPLTGPPDTIRVSAKGASPVFTAKEPPPPGPRAPLAIAHRFRKVAEGRVGTAGLPRLLELTIDDHGTSPPSLATVRCPTFDKALLKAAQTWKYKPALLKGTPSRL